MPQASLPLRAATSDTASLLGDVPGVSLYGAGGVSSLPVIHGLADDRLRIKVDGMDLISACGNHMNPPLSYIDPTNVGSVHGVCRHHAGELGRRQHRRHDPGEFVRHRNLPQQGRERCSRGGRRVSIAATAMPRAAIFRPRLPSEKLSMTYSGSTAQSDNYTAGGDFKPAGPAFISGPASRCTLDQMAGRGRGRVVHVQIDEPVARLCAAP